MQSFFFNSRSELDRCPTGAVASGVKIRLGVRVLSSLEAREVMLHVREDAQAQPVSLSMERVWSERGFDRFEADYTAAAPGLYWYSFTVDGLGVSRDGEVGENCADFRQLTVFDNNYITPDWIKTGAYYHIFVDRFKKGSARPHRKDAVLHERASDTPQWQPDADGEVRNRDFFGGDLDGIIEKLPYLAELGVSCLYLSPIFESASNHKYDTGDYMRIDPAFGDDETFSRLCAEAKKLGLRVICDGVFNHTGDDSVYFDKYSRYGGRGAYNSQSSEYYNWYFFDSWPDSYSCWWNIKTLPKVNADNADYRQYILGDEGVLQKWLDLGCSGWRLDVADELPESFLEELRRRVKSNGDDRLIIGEVWEDASNKISYGSRRHYLQGAQLDSVMNYPLKDAIIGYVTTGNALLLREVTESLCENYPKPALDCLMNVLGTHDTARILTVLGGEEPQERSQRADDRLTGERYEKARERLFVATLLQFTLPGVPCIFYGDEAGLQGWEDPFCRRCFPWGSEDGQITEWYKALLKLRKASPALAGGSYRTISAGDGVFCFERESRGQRLCVCVNLGDGACPLPVGKILLSRGLQAGGLLPNGYAVIEANII